MKYFLQGLLVGNLIFAGIFATQGSFNHDVFFETAACFNMTVVIFTYQIITKPSK